MEVLKRFDQIVNKNCTHTVKYMKNGEVRERMVWKNGASFLLTTAGDWIVADEMPWQDPHYHGSPDGQYGSIEVYTQGIGWSLFMWRENSVIRSKFLDHQGQTLTLYPGIEHTVLIGPKGVISTQKFGNKSPSESDWHPASQAFLIAFQQKKKRIEEQLIKLL